MKDLKTNVLRTFHQQAGLYGSDVLASVKPGSLTTRWAAPVYTLTNYGVSVGDFEALTSEFADERCLSMLVTSGSYMLAQFKSEFVSTSFTNIAARLKVYSAASFSGAGTMLALATSGSGATAAGYLGVFKINTATAKIRCELYRLDAGVPTLLGTSAEVDTNGCQIYQIRMGLTWTTARTLNLKFWQNATAEPDAWNLSFTPASYVFGSWDGIGSCDTGGGTAPAVSEIAWIAANSQNMFDPTADPPIYPTSHWERFAYLEDSKNVVNVLVEAGVIGWQSTGSTTPVSGKVLMSTMGFITGKNDWPYNAIYEDVVNSVTDFTQRMNELLQGRSTQGLSDIVIANPNRVRSHWLRWNWDGQTTKLLVGAPHWPICDYVVGLRGTNERIEERGTELVLKLRDSSNLLARRMQENLIGGTTVNAGKPKPLTYGKCFNVTPVLIDAATHEYQVHDGPITSITELREGGSAIAVTTPDYANGKFKLGANPSYDLRCDVDNSENQTLYGSVTWGSAGLSHRNLFATLAYLHSALALDQINPQAVKLSASESGSAAECGIHIPQEHMNTDAALDEVVLSSVGFWYWNRWGELSAAEFNLAQALSGVSPNNLEFDFVEDDLVERKLQLKRLILPSYVRQFYFKRNWAPQDVGSLAGVVTEDNKALFAAPGTLYTPVDPWPSVLDRPQNHALARQREPQMTLYRNAASYPGDDDAVNWYRAVGIFQMTSRKNAMKLEIGSLINLVHSDYGFSAGASGVLVGFSKNLQKREATFDVAFILAGDFPLLTDTSYPFVTEQDFE